MLGEARGSLFYRKRLEIEVIEPNVIKEVKEALASFIQGDFSKVKLLRDFSGDALESLSRHTDQCEIIRAVNYYFDSLSSRENKSIPYKRRKELADDFKNSILENHTTMPPEELETEKKGLIGIFHVHQNGSPPSSLDVETNVRIQIPELVFSATPFYRTNGLKIYLVAKGACRKLYDGPLKINSDGNKIVS